MHVSARSLNGRRGRWLLLIVQCWVQRVEKGHCSNNNNKQICIVPQGRNFRGAETSEVLKTSKHQIMLLLVLAYWTVPDQRPLKGCVCVCVFKCDVHAHCRATPWHNEIKSRTANHCCQRFSRKAFDIPRDGLLPKYPTLFLPVNFTATWHAFPRTTNRMCYLFNIPEDISSNKTIITSLLFCHSCCVIR